MCLGLRVGRCCVLQAWRCGRDRQRLRWPASAGRSDCGMDGTVCVGRLSGGVGLVGFVFHGGFEHLCRAARPDAGQCINHWLQLCCVALTTLASNSLCGGRQFKVWIYARSISTTKASPVAGRWRSPARSAARPHPPGRTPRLCVVRAQLVLQHLRR